MCLCQIFGLYLGHKYLNIQKYLWNGMKWPNLTHPEERYVYFVTRDNKEHFWFKINYFPKWNRTQIGNIWFLGVVLVVTYFCDMTCQIKSEEECGWWCASMLLPDISPMRHLDRKKYLIFHACIIKIIEHHKSKVERSETSSLVDLLILVSDFCVNYIYILTEMWVVSRRVPS